jgi:membrane fusion protein (multidrug efflux system)
VDTQTKARESSSDEARQRERDPAKREFANDAQRPDEARPAQADSFGKRLRQHWVLAAVTGSIVVIALVAGLIYWLNIRNYESTDDAFVAARSFSIAPKVSGYVTEVAVTDNQHVAAGQFLARIDQRDYKIAVDQAQAQVATAKANIANIIEQINSQQAQIEQAKAQLEQAQAQLKFAEQEAARAKELVQTGAGTVQREQQTDSDLRAQQANTARAKSAVIAAELQDKVLATQRDSAQASLEQAQAQLAQAKLNLDYTNIDAAQPGKVAKLSAAKGAFVTSGQSLMMFVPDEVWVTANFKETQLRDMRPGQKAEVRIDAYPGRKLNGHVASVQPGSGTVFSLLPAENATGNFVKVVQRVPVKIVVDDWPADLAIGPGMSVVPWVKVR